jgi:hypothetical protein
MVVSSVELGPKNHCTEDGQRHLAVSKCAVPTPLLLLAVGVDRT